MAALLTAAPVGYVALFPVVNPFGNVPIFYSLTAGADRAERRRALLKTAAYVTVILTVFLIAGQSLLHFFGIDLPVLRIAGGLVVGHAAWRMVSSHTDLDPATHSPAPAAADVAFSPMAMPMLAGPGAIGVVIGLTARHGNWLSYPGYVLAILAIGATCYVVLRVGGPISQRVGRSGMDALNRVFGFFTLAIAVEFVVKGIQAIRF
jgi:multiple antibiotic resistance protein